MTGDGADAPEADEPVPATRDAAAPDAAAPRPPLPVVILGGYLGAGKTTLVNRLLRHAAGRRIAVVVNDFGDVDIDGDLIEARDRDTIALAGGCVCCASGDDLLGALARLQATAEPYDHVVLEASGVALPQALRATVSLSVAARVAATVVLADASTVRRLADDRFVGDTVRSQLEAADLVLASKADLVGSEALAATEGWLRRASGAPVLAAVDGEVPVGLLLDADAHRPGAGGRVGEGADRGSRADRAAPGAGARIGPAAPARARFDAASFAIAHAVDPARLAGTIAALPNAPVRAKGIVFSPDGVAHAVQCVGSRWTVSPAPAGTGGAGRLVAIAAGTAVDRDAIESAIAAARAGRGH